MTFDPAERVPIGRTGLSVTRLGFGGASIGGLFSAVADRDAIDVARHAWDIGVRYFDVAPLYGYGAGERRLGRALADRPRDAYVLSTKVGRVIRAPDAIGPETEIDRQALGDREDAYYAGTTDVKVVFDYSADGVRRSIDESLERLGLDHIDLALIHDPDEHWRVAIEQAYPALHRLREAGVVRAIGVGMNQAPMLARFAREGDFDAFLVASRYTLLDQSALDELLPLAVQKGTAILAGGVMNTGLLADPRPGTHYDYRPAPRDVIERAERIGRICARHRVPLKTAAIQFPLAHPAVTSVVAGVRRIDHLDDYPAAFRARIPPELWEDLRAEGIIAAGAPTPA
ncbi:MAG: aldo/keto reductase [Chloroflexota bacterium]